MFRVLLLLRNSSISIGEMWLSTQDTSNMAKFRENLKSAKGIAILTGAGISAESGIPTFRGPEGYWRKWPPTLLASPAAFRDDPSLVWEFYHYRREVARKAKPNPVNFFLDIRLHCVYY